MQLSVKTSSFSPQTPQAQMAGIIGRFCFTEVGEAIVEDGMNSDVEHAGGAQSWIN